MRRSLPCAFATVLGLLVSFPANAHLERPSQFPSGEGSVPVYRTDGPYLVVCRPDTPRRVAHFPDALKERNLQLFRECQGSGFRNIQDAVDAVTERGTRIFVLPGRYVEAPSLAPLSDFCAGLVDKRPLSYEEQVACPHVQNLIAIFGDGPDADIVCDGPLCDLQVEGTGTRPEDVVIDGRFRKLNVVRADRADGVYFRNLTVQNATFNALYIMETDGFVIDRVVGRWNDEYAFLTFASDHGLYVDCEAFGNGDSGIYPGSAADLHGLRPAIEITRCRSHHNLMGLAGTSGNSLYVHGNKFYANSVGISLDSVFPHHPGLPQDSSTFVQNKIWGNNQDYYRFFRDGTCFKPSAERGYKDGVVCPSVGVPIGTGILVAGGNANTFRDNWIWDNWRFGTMLFWAPAPLRGEEDPAKLFDTSHYNGTFDNRMGIARDGRSAPNGLDFWWDEEGEGNCWEGNVSGEGAVTSDPSSLPVCDPPDAFDVGNEGKQNGLLPCTAWSPANVDPAGCDWTTRPRRPRRHG